MKRRDLLLASSAGIASTFAGCSALSGGDGDAESSDDTETETATATPTGPPEFEDISISAADGAQVGSELTLTVAAANVGGETGTYEGTVRLASGSSESAESGDEDGESSFEQSVTIESIAPGETGETEITGPAFEIADDYEFVVADADASATVRVGPASVSVDGTHTLDNDLRVTLTDVEFTNAVHYTYEETSVFSSTEHTGLYGTLPDYLLSVFSFQVENAGTSSASLSMSDIDVTTGSLVTGFENAGLSSAEDLAGRPLSEVELGAGESTEAWLLVQYSREDASDGVSLGYQRDATGTLPEMAWEKTPAEGESLSLPAFSLTERDTPAEAEVVSEPKYDFTVTNDGDAAATFRGSVQFRFEEDAEWNDWKRVSAKIPAGDSTTLSVTSSHTDVGTVQYRLQPVDERFEVQFTPAQRGRGEVFTTPRGLEIAVTNAQSATEITVEDAFGEETRTADDGQQYVITTVEVTRPDSTAPEALDGGISDPSNANFWTTTESDRYSHNYTDPLREPVSGQTVYDISLDPQQTETGYAYHEVPASISLDDVITRWEDEDGDTVAEWHA